MGQFRGVNEKKTESSELIEIWMKFICFCLLVVRGIDFSEKGKKKMWRIGEAKLRFQERQSEVDHMLS